MIDSRTGQNNIKAARVRMARLAGTFGIALLLGGYWFLFFTSRLPTLQSRLPPEAQGGPIRRIDLFVQILLLPDQWLLEAWFGSPPEFGLWDRIPVLWWAGLVVAAMWAAGWLVLGRLGLPENLSPLEKHGFSLAVGANLVSTYTLAVGLAGLLPYRAVFWIPIALLFVGILWANKIYLKHVFFLIFAKSLNYLKLSKYVYNLDSQSSSPQGQKSPLRKARKPQDTPSDLKKPVSAWWAVAVVPWAVLILLGAMLPPVDFDVREYHLQAPKEWYQQGRITFLPHNVYANMPLGAEMLTLAAMGLSGQWWLGALAGKTLMASLTLVCAAALWAVGRRIYSSQAGAVAALLYLATPWIIQVSTAGLNEGVTACYVLLAVWALWLWTSQPERECFRQIAPQKNPAQADRTVQGRTERGGSPPGQASRGCSSVVEVSGMGGAADSTWAGETAAVGGAGGEAATESVSGKEAAANFPPSIKSSVPPGNTSSLARQASVEAPQPPVSPAGPGRQHAPASSWGYLVLGGYLVGAAAGTKYPALVFLAVPALGWVGWQAWQTACPNRRFRNAAGKIGTFVLAVFLGGGLWYVKNACLAGNPVYPLGYSLLGGKAWDAQKEARWNRVHLPRDFSAARLAEDMARLAWQSEWIGPLVAPLAVLAFLRRSQPCRNGSSFRKATQFRLVLLGYLAWWIAMWWLGTHRIDRFWLPALPMAALLAGLGFCWSESRLWRWTRTGLLAVGLLYGFLLAGGVPAAGGYNRYFVPLERLRIDPERVDPWHLWLNQTWLEQGFPKGQVLLVGDAQPFDLEMPVLYATCFNTSPLEQLLWEADARSRPVLAFSSDHADSRKGGGPVGEQMYPDAWQGQAFAQRLKDLLAEREIRYIYVHWGEIARYRSPGNYGFTPLVQPELFDAWVRRGVLQPIPPPSSCPHHPGRCYRVLTPLPE